MIPESAGQRGDPGWFPRAKKAMAYTVKQVATMSGVSVRTLHFYDETGLLKPAYLGANGYRFYEEPSSCTSSKSCFTGSWGSS